jgi:hypothetical protein
LKPLTVSRNVIYQDKSFADPDASELTTNNVGRNMICFGNSLQVQFGDSQGTPNTVNVGDASDANSGAATFSPQTMHEIARRPVASGEATTLRPSIAQ